MGTSSLERCIHYRFSQVKLLQVALTHSSYANEKEGSENNERLEFLGDAVLELVISEEAYRRYPESPEGQLTRVRANLVREPSLADIARELKLHKYLLLGKGEEKQGGRHRDSLLSDAVEAVIGAVYLDGGFDEARKVIVNMFESRWPKQAPVTRVKDYKSRLQEVTQERMQARPVYVLTNTHGPEHEKIFEVEVTLPDGRVHFGSGSSVKRAEQESAKEALVFLGEED